MVFKNNNSLKEVVLGSDLTYIGDEAFSECEFKVCSSG